MNFKLLLVLLVLIATVNGEDYHELDEIIIDECNIAIDEDNVEAVLEGDLSCDSQEYGILIGADNVRLDCQGHTIDGYFYGEGYSGIYIGNAEGIVIQNCNIRNFYNGIKLNNANMAVIANNVISYNYYGIYVFSSDGNELRDNTVNENNMNPVFMWNSNYNSVSENDFRYNGGGVYLITSYYNEFINNSIDSNRGLYGLKLSFSDSNVLHGNYVNGNSGNGLLMVHSEDNEINDMRLCGNSGSDISILNPGNNNLGNIFCDDKSPEWLPDEICISCRFDYPEDLFGMQ